MKITPEQFAHHFVCIGKPNSAFSDIYRVRHSIPEVAITGGLWHLDRGSLSLRLWSIAGRINNPFPGIIIQSESDKVEEILNKYDNTKEP